MRGLVAFAVGLGLVSFGCSGVKTAPAAGTGDVTLEEVVPAQGPLAGNIDVQIKGTGFVADNLLVTFGGTSVSDAQVVNSTTVRGTLPPHAQAGLVDVVVACAAGQATLHDGFEYREAAAISITGITPTSGPLTGGTTVTITGTGFSAGTTLVKFGSNNGTGVSVTSDAQLTVLTPAGAANGPVAVAVVNDNGSTQLPNAFVYGDGGGPGPGGTTTENLGGVAEFDRILANSDPAYSAGQAMFFAAGDVVYPQNNTCALDVNQFPNVTSTLDAGASVTLQQSATSLDLPKDTSNGPSFPIYVQANGPAASFTLGQMSGLNVPGAGGIAAFNQATIAAAPSVDYNAYLDLLGFSNFTSGGIWSGSSDLWLTWETTMVTDHVQILLLGQDMSGAMHTLSCDIRNGDTGAFCIKGGGSGDICQTPGATMTDFYTAINGPTLGIGAANVFLYRGNRSNFTLPNGATGAMDVNVVRATSLAMFN